MQATRQLHPYYLSKLKDLSDERCRVWYSAMADHLSTQYGCIGRSTQHFL